MRQKILCTRSCKTPFNSDTICSSVRGDAGVPDLVRWLATRKMSTVSARDFSSSVCNSNKIGEVVLRPSYDVIDQRRRQHHRIENPLFQSQQQQKFQIRHFVFDSRKSLKAKAKKDPFKVLKVPRDSLYKDVKKKFLRIAMNNHPDMHTDGLSDKEKQAMRDKFIEARMAFERLEEDPSDGMAILIEEKIDREENFDSWFHNETGLKNPFDVDIDPETMKEVAKMTEQMGGKQGMERDGGMWALARMVTSAVEKGGDAASILRLESGDVKKQHGSVPGGSLRRPRRR